MSKSANEYTKKTIYFNLENQDIYDFIQAKGRSASKYICDLIRADLNKDDIVIDENTVKMMINEIDALKRQLNTVPVGHVIKHSLIEEKEEETPYNYNINQDF